MYGSTLEQSSATIESSSKLPAAAQHALPLQRMGSGVSVVLDDDPPADAGAEAESHRKLPSSQYKGVVPQPNGRWGAQIYEKHRRVWLGTFDHESDAARAYDIAAHRFRGLNAITNFTPLSETDDAAELDFIGSHSKTEIVDMLRKQTYGDELRQSKKACGTHKRKIHSGNGRVDREQLFEKAVTPSDVGKLNRLVIPKQQAEKHFPLKTGSNLLLSFEDACGKVWRFRYSYWNSSQSYVLTKGWSRFVKEKGLKAGDVVGFLRSTGPEKQLYIDFKPGDKAFSSVQVIRLFGVNISKRRETESSSPLSQYFIKKQCIRQL